MNAEAPSKFLKVLHQEDTGDTVGLVACAGFELGEWRAKKLAEHLLNWLPHFALRPSEIQAIGPQNVFKLLKEAASRLFKSAGEAKLYTDMAQAVTAALASLQGHLDAGFLEETKILIGPKIEPTSPGYKKLQWLFDDGNTLDEIISRIVVPVLIASDSKAAADYKTSGDQYDNLVIEEYAYVKGRFESSEIAKRARIVVMYVPLASKDLLVTEFAKKLGAFE